MSNYILILTSIVSLVTLIKAAHFYYRLCLMAKSNYILNEMAEDEWWKLRVQYSKTFLLNRNIFIGSILLSCILWFIR